MNTVNNLKKKQRAEQLEYFSLKGWKTPADSKRISPIQNT